MTNHIYRMIDDIEAKCLAQLKRLRDLRLAVAIRELWKDAHAGGRCAQARLDGNLSRPEGVTFLIENGLGHEKCFELSDVPDILLRHQIDGVDHVEKLEKYLRKIGKLQEEPE